MVDLGLLLAFLLSIVSHGLALGMAYPTSLEAGITVSIRWSDGVIPYTMVVLNQANNNVLYSYYGNDNITYWDTNAAAGTVIIFKVTDADGTYLDSVPVTVNENPAFQSSSSIHSLSSISVASVSHDSRASISELSTASVASVSATMTTATSTIASSSVTRTSTTSGNGNSTTLLEASGVAGTSTLTSSTSPPVSGIAS
ncbi:hypothetical protein DL93DRAFT_659350 [Clavulina sp. PMI_390]|nr:hypothetical protein DL93DRAFT_659350 [Clavulina sp. PMI_390]